MSAPRVFTIGHAAHPLEHLLGLLQAAVIGLVADVRSRPFSRFAPHYCKKPLSGAISAAGMEYRFLGRELGGQPGPHVLEALGVSEASPPAQIYAALAAGEAFRHAVAQVAGLARSGSRIALLCGEEAPQNCHRRLLVGRALEAQGLELCHIRGDGRLQREAELACGCQQGSLFDVPSPGA